MENFVHDSPETQAIRQRMSCNMPTGFSNPKRSNQTRTISMKNRIMRNRIFEYRPTARRSGQFSKAAIPESRQLTQRQNAFRTHGVEAYVTEHPLTAIGAAFSIGVFLAWLIKRK